MSIDRCRSRSRVLMDPLCESIALVGSSGEAHEGGSEVVNSVLGSLWGGGRGRVSVRRCGPRC